MLDASLLLAATACWLLLKMKLQQDDPQFLTNVYRRAACTLT